MVDITQDILDTKVRLCLDCGKCTVVCPVAQCDSSFNPRLITQRRLGQRDSNPQDETIWSCVNCYMCVERCNYRVRFPEFISAMRSEALAEGYQAQCSHGGMLQALMHMMARKDLKQDRLGWLPHGVEVSDKCETLFFVGCAPYFDVIFNDLSVSTLQGVKGSLKMLNHAGIPFSLLDNERCCGHDLIVQGDRSGFHDLARANIEDFARHGIKRIITNCPECLHTLKVDYSKVEGGGGIEVLHLTQVISALVERGDFSLGRVEGKATYHDPCALGRCARVFDEPRTVLSAVAGLELVEMDHSREKSLCCGSSPWVHCSAVNRKIQERRLAQAEAVGADLMVTACPKCQIHLRCAQKAGGTMVSQMQIQDLASLLAQSLD